MYNGVGSQGTDEIEQKEKIKSEMDKENVPPFLQPTSSKSISYEEDSKTDEEKEAEERSKIFLQCLVYKERLEDKGYKDEDIRKKVAFHERILLDVYELAGRIKPRRITANDRTFQNIQI